jgi:hypothetical protein
VLIEARARCAGRPRSSEARANLLVLLAGVKARKPTFATD